MARGHIKKYKGKRKESWQVVVSLGWDPETGRYRQKRVTVNGTKKDAERVLRELLQQVEDGTFVDPGKITIAEYLHKWLETHKQNLAPSTYRRYRVAVEQHIIPCLGSIPLGKLQPLQIQDFLAKELEEGRKDNKKSTGRGLTPATVRYTYTVLHKALKDAVKWQMLYRNPADYVTAPKAKREEPVVLDEQHVKKLLNELKGTYLYMPTYLAIYTGMRMGEILGLTWQDVDLDRGVVTIRQASIQRNADKPEFGQPKTAKSRRRVDISPSVVRELREHRKCQLELKLKAGPQWEDFNLVCSHENGRPVNPPTLSSRFSRTASKLGLPVTFHGLRHTHASLLIKAGVPAKVISERLGHSSIRTTMDTYGHLMDGMQKEAARKLEKLLDE